MPTITQLPETTMVTASDLFPISQDGSARAVSLGTVLGSVQPTITVASPSLIGRTSLGAGGPEQVGIGEGLELSGTALVANGSDHANFALLENFVSGSDLVISNQGKPMLMPTTLLRNLFTAGSNIAIGSDGIISSMADGGSIGALGLGSAIGGLEVITSLAAQDLVAVSQNGFDHSIQYTKMLNGVTIDQAQVAAPAEDSDLIWSAQTSNVMMKQNLGSIWTWISNKMLASKISTIELTNDANLNANDHNGRMLICSQPITLTPLVSNMGSGFSCKLINVSGGNVTLGSHFITSSGSYTIASWQSAEIFCITYSNGSFAFASFGNTASTFLPGQVTGLTGTVSSPTSITLTWQLPNGVNIPTSYSIQYSLATSSSWVTIPLVLSTPTYSLQNLQSGETYNIIVQASNAAGSGPSSNVLTLSTPASAQVPVPAQVVGIAANSTSSSTIQLSWTTQTGISAALSYVVQYRSTGSSSWTGLVTGLTGSTTNISGLQAGTSYDFIVSGINTSGAGPVSSVVSASTAILAHSVNSIIWNLLPTGTYNHSSGAIGINAHVSPMTSPIQFGFSLSTSVPPANWTQASYVNTDLWGAYVPTPSSSGSWFVWGEGIDGSCITVSTTPFIVQ